MTRIQKVNEIDLFEFEGCFVRVKGKLKKFNSRERGKAFLSGASAVEESDGCIQF